MKIDFRFHFDVIMTILKICAIAFVIFVAVGILGNLFMFFFKSHPVAFTLSVAFLLLYGLVYSIKKSRME